LYVRPDPGSASELALLGGALERLTAMLPRAPLVIADAALGNIKPLLDADRAGIRFIVPLRTATGFRERFVAEVGHPALRYASERGRRLPPQRRTRYRGALVPFEVRDPDTGEVRRLRVAYIQSSEEAREVSAARERALQKAQQALERIRGGLGGRHYKTQAQVDTRVARILEPAVEGLLIVTTGVDATGRPTLAWRRDRTAIKQAAQTDGISALATNLPGRLTAGAVLRTYKQQSHVERRHRDLKQTLKVRPIFLHNDDRITALVSIVGLALLTFGLIETELRKRLDGDEQLPGLLGEGRAARPTGRNILAAFQGLGLTYTHHGIRLDPLTPTQRHILQLLQIQAPWPEQPQPAVTNCGRRS
jgi:hypothetical protein